MFFKVSKAVVVVLVSFAVVTAFSAVSFAYCTNITVVKAGAKVDGTTATNSIALQRDGATTGNGCTAWTQGSPIWFTAMTENQDAMLAAALTAMSLGHTVTVTCATEPCIADGTGILTLITVE
jgi:hypothetical protein